MGERKKKRQGEKERDQTTGKNVKRYMPFQGHHFVFPVIIVGSAIQNFKGCQKRNCVAPILHSVLTHEMNDGWRWNETESDLIFL